MPVKRRSPKAREDDLFLWNDFFEGGCDLLMLRPDVSEEEKAAQAPEAWRRLGARFLAARDPDSPPPWALTEYGEPPQYR